MTVEMEMPFVWPAEPESYEDWNKETYEKAQKDNEEYQERMGRLADTMYSKKDRMSLKEQAKALLSGREKWRSGKQG